MKNSYKFTFIGATLLLAASSQAGQFYVGVDGGAVFQNNPGIRSGTGFGGSSGDVKFDTGWRAGGVIGYSFCNYFSTELDASVIYNRINQIGNQPLSPVGANAHLDEFPLLVNGVFTWPLGKFRPYAGIGVGAAVGNFEGNNIPGSTNPSYRNTDVTFAYQAEVGISYTVVNHLDLGVAYKFTGTTDHDWTDNGVPLKTDGTMAQSIMGTITYRF